MAQHCVRLTGSLEEQVKEAAQRDGSASIPAFIRSAIQNELKRRRVGFPQAEQEVSATLERQRRDLKTLIGTLRAQFALTDAFARMMLHCVPEPPAEVHDDAVAQAKHRHQKLLRMAAINMNGDARAALENLIGNGE